MRQLLPFLTGALLVGVTPAIYAQSGPVAPFHKVIVSPYIQATFIQGDRESVTINSTIVDSSDLHVEVHGGTLRLYLEGAKDIPHNLREYGDDGRGHSYHPYPNHAVIATIVYKKLDALSLRGTETFLCESPLFAKNFSLHVYGNSRVIFPEVHISRMYSTLYGESSLDIRSGEVKSQHYTSYGDGKVVATAILGQSAKVVAFGDAEFRVNVSDWIKVTAFGDAKLRYLGNPVIVKGIHLGDMDLQKLD